MRVGSGVGVNVGSGVSVGSGVNVSVGVIVGVGVSVLVTVGVAVGISPRLSITLTVMVQRQQKRMNAPKIMRVSLRRSGAKIQVMARMGNVKMETRQHPELLLFVDAIELDDFAEVDEVIEECEMPVPGMPTVLRMPRLPTLTEKPLPPKELEMPDLLRLIFQPGEILRDLRKRKGMKFPFYEIQWAAGC